MNFAAAQARCFRAGIKNGRKPNEWKDIEPTPENRDEYFAKAMRHVHAAWYGDDFTTREAHLVAASCNLNILWYMLGRAEANEELEQDIRDTLSASLESAKPMTPAEFTEQYRRHPGTEGKTVCTKCPECDLVSRHLNDDVVIVSCFACGSTFNPRTCRQHNNDWTETSVHNRKYKCECPHCQTVQVCELTAGRNRETEKDLCAKCGNHFRIGANRVLT